jgi:probable rRNA maturation factor
MPSSRISFFNENIHFKPKKIKEIRVWLNDTITSEGLIPGEINFIYSDDTYLHEMNLKYLAHDTLTDVITFDYREENIISGDIFISVEQVKENAQIFLKSFNDELHRVMVHGVLHLCGYKDKTAKDSAIMRQKEEHYLSALSLILT